MMDRHYHNDMSFEDAVDLVDKCIVEIRSRLVIAPPNFMIKIVDNLFLPHPLEILRPPLGVWVPIYDRFLVRVLAKVTGHEEGLTLLQRMGIGLVFSSIAMAVAGIVEKHRREWTVAHNMPLSVLWLAPQLILMGLAEAFNFIAQIEFYNKQFPENMRSIATSLFFCTGAGANYLSSLITSLVHSFTSGPSGHGWLDDNLNRGRLDYFYLLLAALGGINVIYFLVVSLRYHYKIVQIEEMKPTHESERQLSSVKL